MGSGIARDEPSSRECIVTALSPSPERTLLARRSVLIVGAGGLGCPAALALADAGIGRIGLIDGDRVDLSNLHRQILHRTADLDRLKVESARDSLWRRRLDLHIDCHAERLDEGNALRLFPRYDFVIDGSDNFETKYLVNAAALRTSVPYCYGGVLRFEGQLLTVLPGRSGCYRCLFRDPPPPGLVQTCQEAGVLGAVAGVIGALQAQQAVQTLLGRDVYADRLLIYQALAGRFREVRFRRDPECPACGTGAAADAPAPGVDPTRPGTE